MGEVIDLNTKRGAKNDAEKFRELLEKKSFSSMEEERKKELLEFKNAYNFHYSQKEWDDVLNSLELLSPKELAGILNEVNLNEARKNKELGLEVLTALFILLYKND